MKIKLILVAFLFTSCAQNCRIEEPVGESLFSISIPKFSDHKVFKYSDVYSNVTSILLEDNPEVNLGNIYSLEITKEGDFLIFDLMNHCIALYDSVGHYKNLIGEIGHSQKEYVFPTSVAYDSYRNNVVVWDNVYLKIYDIKGQFVSAMKLPWSSGEIKVLDSDNYVVFKNPYMVEKGEVGSSIKIIGKDDGQVLHEYMSFKADDFDINTNPAVNSIFSIQEDGVQCLPPYSSELFHISKDGMYPILSITNESTSDKWIFGKDWSDIKQKHEQSMHAGGFENRISKLFNTPRFVISNLSFNGAIYLWIVDKKTKKMKCLADGAINDMTGYIGSSYIQTVKGDNVYCLIDPVSYMQYLQNYPQNIQSEQDWNLMQKMSQMKGPIIQVCTIK